MSRGLQWCNAVYRLALTIWIGLIVAALVGGTAAMAILPELGVTIDDFLAYDVREHGRIAAEKLTEPILTFADLAQIVAAALVLVTATLQIAAFRLPLRSPAAVLRITCLSLATMLFAIRMAFVMPGLNRSMRSYWESARLAQVEAAGVYRDSLDAAQSIAWWMLVATLVLLLIAVLVDSSAPAVAGADDSPHLEPPALLRERGEP